MKKIIFAFCVAFFCASFNAFAKPKEVVSVSTNNAIKVVFSYGFVNLEGAIEVDGDKIKGNEGQITKVYVNDKAETAKKGKKSGNFVIIEVNTAYMLSSQNLIYTTSMIASAKQVGTLKAADKSQISENSDFVTNYTTSASIDRHGVEHTNYEANKSKIILPQFAEGSLWTLNYEGTGTFKATNCFSEYTGKYEDFELPYAIYVPDEKTMEANKGNISLTIHMEHAASLGSDPMSALTSSIAASKHASSLVQKENPAIIVVPQVEESRRLLQRLLSQDFRLSNADKTFAPFFHHFQDECSSLCAKSQPALWQFQARRAQFFRFCGQGQPRFPFFVLLSQLAFQNP